MSNKRWYEWLLTVVYAAMVVLCIFLNFSAGHKESLATIIVNIVMFIIVGIIFITADKNSFIPMNLVIKDLTHASEKIRKDAMNTHSYLWEPYSSSNVELFKSSKLQEIFRDFLFELNRENDAENIYYKPNIDEYINDELVDKIMHRNEMNQVAGMLTGLGILGTFIGLSLGLQNFNTGTTAEMTNSIEPLMNGIKVAFHTSIYGMVFSLTFNSIYKKKLYEAESAVDTFIAAFKKYVLPDTKNDGMNQIIMLQEDQINAINNLASSMSDELADIITPHLDRIQASIIDFENMATRNQAESMTKIVDFFISEMNKALNGSFWQLNKAIEDMYQIQKDNAAMMQDVLKATSQSTGNINEVNQATENLISTLNKYSEAIQAVLDGLQNTITDLNKKDNDSKNILEQERAMLSEQRKLLSNMNESIDIISKSSEKTGAQISEALLEMNDGMYLLRRSLEKQQAKPASTTTRR